MQIIQGFDHILCSPFKLETKQNWQTIFYKIYKNTFSDKSVSFEKSVSFSDDIQGLPKSHSPQHPGKSMSLKITAV